MTRRRSGFPCGTILLGLGLMPVVFAITFFGLVLAAEAMGVGSLSALERAVQGLLASTGLVPAPTGLEPTSFNFEPSPTPLQPQPTEPVAATETPSPTASPSLTASPSATSTLTETSTLTPTLTATATLTPSATSTPSPSATFTATASATRTRTPTPPPTRTPTTTATQPPAPTASHTSEVPPTEPGPTFTPTTPPTASACAASADSGVEAQVIGLVNAERVAQGLAAYSVDSRLTAAARVHATDMACNHFTSHTGSDGSSVRDRVEAQGYTWSWIGENYYVTSDTDNGAQVAFDWWMNSTLHRNNLLSPNYTQFGVGYVYDADSDYGGYFVVVFAKPG